MPRSLNGPSKLERGALSHAPKPDPPMGAAGWTPETVVGRSPSTYANWAYLEQRGSVIRFEVNPKAWEQAKTDCFPYGLYENLHLR